MIAPGEAVTAAQDASFDPYVERDRLSRFAAALPPPELAAVPPSLREAAAQLPPQALEQLNREMGAATPDDLAALPPGEWTAALTDTFAHRLLALARGDVALRAGIAEQRAALSPEGYAAAMAEARRGTKQQADAAHAVLDQELDRLEGAATAELARYSAGGFAHPELELAVRARFADAFAAGPEAVAQLFDAHLAGDATAARVLAEVAGATLAAVGHGDPRWGAARTLQPIAAAYADALKPPAVKRAEEQRAAVAATRQRLVNLRAVIGV